MTPRSPAAALAVVALVTGVTIAGCSSGGQAQRTTPNEAELSAVTRASGFAGDAGRVGFGAPWVQLWTQSQLPAAIARCLRGGRLTVDSCYAAHPVDTRVYAMSDRQRNELYGYYLTFLDRCLLAQGFRVDRIPERAAFLSAVNDGRPWSPYDLVTVETRADWYAVSDACPPVPADIDRALRAG